MGPCIVDFVENKLEGWLGLKINREKTRIITVRAPEATLDFLGYSFRWERDLQGREHHWLRLFPSEETMQRQRQWLRDNISHRHCFEPLAEMMDRLNRHYAGWKWYFSLGYPRREYRQINWHPQAWLNRHLLRRSQRGYQEPENLGLQTL